MTDILDGIQIAEEKPPCQCWGRKVILNESGDLVPCPTCAVITNSPAHSVDPGANIELIPEKFRDVFFDITKILEDNKIPEKVRKDLTFPIYLKALEKIVYSSSNGMLSSKSLFLAAPPGFGKNHAVYAAMEGAMRYGLTVAPYYDCGELREMIDKQQLKSDYYTADICFVKITSGNVTVQDLQCAKLITERRARRNKPTIITSRMPVNYFTKMEPSIVELIRKDVSDGDYFRWQYLAAPFIFYEGKR